MAVCFLILHPAGGPSASNSTQLDAMLRFLLFSPWRTKKCPVGHCRTLPARCSAERSGAARAERGMWPMMSAFRRNGGLYHGATLLSIALGCRPSRSACRSNAGLPFGYIHSGHVHRIYVSNSHLSTMCIKRAFEFCFSNFAMARFRQCCGDAGFFFVGLRYPVVIGEWQPRRPLASKVPVVDSA